MKNIFYLSFLVLLLAGIISCGENNSKQFVLNGYVENAEEAETVWLFYIIQKDGKWLEIKDSAQVVNGQFEFKGTIEGLTGAYIKINEVPSRIYLEPALMKMTVDRNVPYTYKLSGTSVDAENDEIMKQLENNRKLCSEKYLNISSLSEEMDSHNDDSTNDSLANVLNREITEYQVLDRDSANEIRFDFISKHPDYQIIPDLLYQISDKGTVRADTLRKIYTALPENVRNSMVGRLANEQISWLEYKENSFVGCTAPDISGTTFSGDVIKLSGFRDKNYVLLDFWASWCGPCLRGIPQIESIYEKYDGKGLEIIGISLDDDKMEWENAINKYRLNAKWDQILNIPSADNILFDKSDISEAYSIEYIPLYVLIDKQGKVIGRWQHIGQEELSFIDKTINEKR